MHIDYNDIKDNVPFPPIWTDHSGVPRYEPFTPEMLSVYGKYALYVKIQCQACPMTFYVGESWSALDYTMFGENWDDFNFQTIANNYHYGDPPIHGCCGDTMNCIDLEIVEAWQKSSGTYQWERQPKIEATDITQDWAK